jgi:hypothetical protein
MKALLIAFYGCLLEVINCSLTKQERRSVNRKVQFWPFSCRYKNTATAVVLGRECSSGSHLDTRVSGFCWDCKMFCPMSRIRPVTARPAPQLQISCQNFASFPICVKMFHPLCYFVATVIRVQSVSSQICVGLYIHTYVHTYTYSLQYRDAGLSQELKNGIALYATCQRNLSACRFVHAWHRFFSSALESCTYFKIAFAITGAPKNAKISSEWIFSRFCYNIILKYTMHYLRKIILVMWSLHLQFAERNWKWPFLYKVLL